MTLLAGDLRSFVLDDDTVSGMIGGRMYPNLLPQKVTYPALSYSLISEVYGHVMNGADGLPSVRIQIDAWAETKEQAEALSLAVHRRLDAYKGTMDGLDVQGVFAAGGGDGIEPNLAVYRRRRDYIVWARDDG